MLSISHQKAYQEFMTLLNNWQKICQNHQDIVELSAYFPNLQRCFQQEIATLTDDELDESVISFWRSLQPEIQREFRLLSTDMLFLASSRQASTKENRLKLICDRTSKLIVYCQKMLEIHG